MNVQSLARRIPKVDVLLASAELAPLLDAHPRKVVVDELRATLDELRRHALDGELDEAELAFAAVRGRLEARLERRLRPYYRRVVNATGVILHTGLGRASLAAPAVAALAELAGRPQRVEIELSSGQRGGRDRGCARLLTEVIGCESATVVNNNAAATMLILAAFARGKDVLLSRGEMVEIGGSFRIPDVMEESGARLVGVGTTNRTHEKDYRRAIGPETGMILKVHTSNYRVVGFTKEVDVATLVGIGREHGVPVVHDLGSGCLVDLARYGRPGEELVKDSLAAGADLVCFSGDKLLGGPQAGIIAGRAEAVERCRRHPLMRAFRPGRLVYTALEATLALYAAGEDEALRQVPALRALVTEPEVLKRRARALARRLRDVPGFEVSVVESRSQAGSGSLPARDYASWGVRLVPVRGSLNELAAALREGMPSILARLHEDALVFDLRTLYDDEPRLVEVRLRELTET